ncbi:MAG: M28 family peptidase [Ignavibacteriae bacterium]|nr:M28 family peptidase [Ignavibacteriota bacterium]NOG99977.1 M28 family peptidase [Ignavibacteriota bacterium]
MRNRLSQFLNCILIASFIFSCNEKEEQIVIPAYKINFQKNSPIFDADNAFAMIKKQTDFGPRNPNSEGHKNTLAFLSSKLNQYADEVILQNFEYPGYDGEKLSLTNIIGKFNPEKENRILLCAHWDTRPWADEEKDPQMQSIPIIGANDGASGVAVLLETARIISENKLNYGLDIIFFDGEDYGKANDLLNFCLGSKYFSASVKQNDKPIFAILLDLVGDKNAQFKKELYSVQYAPDIVELVWNTAKFVNAAKFINTVGNPIYDDHVPLNSSGIKSINIVDVDYVGHNTTNRNYWHTHADSIDKIGIETLQQVGNVIVKLLYSISF